jgi:hypothetical protein
LPTEIAPDVLRPLPLRVTQRQYLRLVAHRSLDSLPIQEHVRRALDVYLDELDRKRPLERLEPVEKKPAVSPAPDGSPAPSAPAARTSPKAKSPAVPAPEKAARRADKLAFR